MEAISERKTVDTVLSSILMTLIICSKLINSSISQFYSGSLKTGLITMGFIWLCLLVYYVLTKRRTVSIIGTTFICYILAFLGLSYFTVGGHSHELFLHYIEYGVLGFLIAGTNFDIEKATRFSGYLLLLLSVPTIRMIQNSYRSYGNLLGLVESYTILPPAFAVLAHFLYFRKKHDWIMYLSYILTVFLLYSMVFRGIRGAILCVIALIIFILLNRNPHCGEVKLGRIALVITLLLLVLNYDRVLSWVADIPAINNIHIRFIEKSISIGKALAGDYSNGRTAIYKIAFQDFIKSPIWGNGIGYFPEAHNINYPHNIVLQVMAEGGILLAAPIIGLLVYCMYLLLFAKISNRYMRITIILLASSTIPAASVSDELWNYPLLWTLFGVLIKKYHLLAEDNRERMGSIR